MTVLAYMVYCSAVFYDCTHKALITSLFNSRQSHARLKIKRFDDGQ